MLISSPVAFSPFFLTICPLGATHHYHSSAHRLFTNLSFFSPPFFFPLGQCFFLTIVPFFFFSPPVIPSIPPGSAPSHPLFFFTLAVRFLLYFPPAPAPFLYSLCQQALLCIVFFACNPPRSIRIASPVCLSPLFFSGFSLSTEACVLCS